MKKTQQYLLAALCVNIPCMGNLEAQVVQRSLELEEVIVTAQKRKELLQSAPIAISALQAVQLEAQGITSLDALSGGIIPSARLNPFPTTPSTITMTIRGLGPADIGQITREPSVAIYRNGIYLGRAQGLSADVTDLERIEILRGPQGTLFGRNATGGAVNLISKKPAGELKFRQTIGVGNYDFLQSITRLDLPTWANISTKFDFIHSERDGWVTNPAPGESDYNEFEKDGGALSLLYAPVERFTLEYAYDQSRVSATQNYFQTYIDTIGLVGIEHDRRERARAPAIPLDPTVTRQYGHALTATWNWSDQVTVKSLTAYRDLDEDTHSNYGAAIYYNGLLATGGVDQNQVSQEFQVIGSSQRLEWLAGLFWYKEDGSETVQNLFSLDTFGNPPNQPIIPATNIDLFTGQVVPLRKVDAETKSTAIYGQLSWTPNIWNDRMRITGGVRYTSDRKSADRTEYRQDHFSVDTEHVDPAIALDFKLTDDVMVYAKWSTAYKAAGVNTRSASFAPYDEEEVRSYEIGLKSEFWHRRARLNMAAFDNETEDLQIDFANPNNTSISETTNGINPVTVRGAELDFTVVPVEGLTLGISYTYLDGDMPNQPNPMANGALEPFEVTQTPRHAGSLTVDYIFPSTRIGQWRAHLDATSTSAYAYAPKNFNRFDGYTLFNARFSLEQIPLRAVAGELIVSVWGKNLTDEEYVVYSFPIGDPLIAIDDAFGDPRTFGIDFTYKYE